METCLNGSDHYERFSTVFVVIVLPVKCPWNPFCFKVLNFVQSWLSNLFVTSIPIAYIPALGLNWKENKYFLLMRPTISLKLRAKLVHCTYWRLEWVWTRLTVEIGAAQNNFDKLECVHARHSFVLYPWQAYKHQTNAGWMVCQIHAVATPFLASSRLWKHKWIMQWNIRERERGKTYSQKKVHFN